MQGTLFNRERLNFLMDDRSLVDGRQWDYDDCLFSYVTPLSKSNHGSILDAF